MDQDQAFADQTPALTAWFRARTGDPHLADDLLQTTLLKAHQARQRFRGDADGFRGWLFTIARNVWRDHLKKPRRQLSDDSPDSRPAPADTGPAAHFQRRELAAFLATAVAELPPKLQEAYRLRVEQGLSFRAMAETLNEPADRLMGRAYLALKQLRTAYQRRYPDD